MTRSLLRDSAGKVIGACDAGFDILGRRPWRPRARPAVAADKKLSTDINVEIDAPRMRDALAGYTRLR